MSFPDARDVPADPTSMERLAAVGLEYRVVDMADDASAEAFQRAGDRGFLDAEPNAESLAQVRKTYSERRNVGVFESGAPASALPVGTTNSWVTPLTVPGAELSMWAISMVSVAATHRRRGIARSLLEGELRAAASAGVSVAGLTASEATIYTRYGFGAAIPAMRYSVDTRRAGWRGLEPAGRVEYVDRETLANDLGSVHDRARRTVPGRVAGWRGRWEGMSGAATSEPERDKIRGVRYTDEAGEVRGALAYSLHQIGDGFRFRLNVRILVAETPEALAALWRFALQHDLVDEVTADSRPVDDTLPWLVADQRAVTQTVHDHGWLRVLDVPAALTARRYSAALELVMHVEDSLGFAHGDWRLRVDGTGSATVEPAEDGDADVTLDVSALSALYAGGVRAASLHGAGRITADAPAVEALDRAFISFPAPSLDIWY
ncbi:MULTISPECIES: GNAT family N-acetyltransferase [unclassified Microbacterium]|uniref:GNAT family N-acetyltransferase n=1 Tax=unclassified Microbacterium TaxID=2609290 RepID=UPI000EAAB416|nr:MULTISPECIES: GNAT family N-acetyltransferase [unclassified Microbacterium]MBT2485448.1 GNAT family N-acetyltransferase [Microbacterium sp. ISL-108]RKN68244.1 GNAT family N-acetyltransferase [Microbacterium sp. CGR2]